MSVEYTAEEVRAYADKCLRGNDGQKMLRDYAALLERRAEGVTEAVRVAGAMLANCALNLAQCDRLTTRERQSLNASRKVWDAAIATMPVSAEPAQPADSGRVGDEDLRQEWRNAGGSVHGPHVETVTMPEADYFVFRRALAAQGQGDAVVRECRHEWVDYMQAEYKPPHRVFNPGESNVARYVRIGLMCTICGKEKPAPAASPAGVPEGLAVAAEYIQKKADAYAEENCGTEWDTGATTYHYGQAGEDYHHTLLELAEEIAALSKLAAAPSAQESQPNG